jgi:hypothetical protein
MGSAADGLVVPVIIDGPGDVDFACFGDSGLGLASRAGASAILSLFGDLPLLETQEALLRRLVSWRTPAPAGLWLLMGERRPTDVDGEKGERTAAMGPSWLWFLI